MKPDLTYESEQLNALHSRWLDLKTLAAQLAADRRWLSTALATDDPLVDMARSDKITPPWPLTIGTLMAAVLSETDSVENAIHCYERRLHPKHSASAGMKPPMEPLRSHG